MLQCYHFIKIASNALVWTRPIKIDASVNMLRVHYACLLLEFCVKSSTILGLTFKNQNQTLAYWASKIGVHYQNSDILKRQQKFETISHLIWHLLSKRQIKWEIVSNFVAFLENLNFTILNRLNFPAFLLTYVSGVSLKISCKTKTNKT